MQTSSLSFKVSLFLKYFCQNYCRKMTKLPLCKFALVIICLILCICLLHQGEGKDQYVTPLNMGMKATVPWDIANLFNRYPIQGALSVALAVALMALIFFGVITAPFGYFFGIPSEKYVLGDIKMSEPIKQRFSDRMDNLDFIGAGDVTNIANFSDFGSSSYKLIGAPRSLSGTDKFWPVFFSDVFDLNLNLEDNNQNPAFEESRSHQSILDTIWESYSTLVKSKYSPDFMESIFYWMPSTVRGSCDLLTVCYAHGAIRRLPSAVLTVYHLFSGKFSSIPENFRKAILTGLDDPSNCLPIYTKECSENPFTVVLKSYLNFLPQGRNVQKRKQAMYL